MVDEILASEAAYLADLEGEPRSALFTTVHLAASLPSAPDGSRLRDALPPEGSCEHDGSGLNIRLDLLRLLCSLPIGGTPFRVWPFRGCTL